MSAAATPSLLESVLRTAAPTLIYDVGDVQAVVAAVHKATKTKLSPVDGRGAATGASVKTAIAQQAKSGGPVVVLVSAELSDTVREALSTIVEGVKAPKLVLLSNAPAPSEHMAALCPLQMAASRLFEGGR